jgi:transposase
MGLRHLRAYDRHATTSLFAALDVATGKVIGRCHRRHRAVEFRKFLDHIEANVPADLDVHLILDNYATHKAPAVQRWLASAVLARGHWAQQNPMGSTRFAFPPRPR